jgi:AcrR family transcriptional regulator
VEELPTTHRRIGPTEESVVDRLLDVAGRLLGPLDSPTQERIRFTSVVCAGALGHWVGGYLWQLDRSWWTDERFVGELAHVVSAYLGSVGLIGAAGVRPREDRTPAVPAEANATRSDPTTPAPAEAESTRSYHVPRQRRSRETFERILTTVERLLEHHALDELSIDRICAEADVSQSSFFARFPSREALVEALADRYVALGAHAVGAAEHLLSSLGTAAPEVVVELMIREYFAFERRSTTLRLVALENAVARRRFRTVEEATMARLVDVAEAVLGPLDLEDQQRIRFLSVFCTGAVDQWIGGHVQPLARSWWDDEQFITELVGMVTAYLGSWVRRA